MQKNTGIIKNIPVDAGQETAAKILQNGVSAPKKDINILFLGDLMFDRYIRQVAQINGNDFIFEKIRPLLMENDLIVANLEGPITENVSKSISTVPGEKGHLSFTFDVSLGKTLSENNIKLVNIGNNHIMNFGNSGLSNTEENLAQVGISYFGCPEKSQNLTAIKNIGGTKMGFINYNQFSGCSLEETLSAIKNMRNEADVVAVYTHWGKEYEKNVSENIRTLAHQFIDQGADLVIGSHPHIIQPKEEYRGHQIYYSLGNFIFDQYFSSETKEGLAVRVKISPDSKKFSFEDIDLSLETNGQTKISQLEEKNVLGYNKNR